MLRNYLTRVFRHSFARRSKPTKEDVVDLGTVSKYHPKEKLSFTDGRHLLFDYANFDAMRLFYLITSGLFAGATYWSLKKLYNYQDRGIFGFLFYPAIAYFAVTRLYRYSNVYNSVVM
jgi:hypothetical protein